jgi:exonuclease VII small subunit
MSNSFNYFNYFTEIEEHFQRRRGSHLLLSTLDWALIETWREAGIPLEAVLRGIDDAFDKYEARQRKSTRRLRQINGLAWTAQAVLEAAEQQLEAATGTNPESRSPSSPTDLGFEINRIANHLETAAQALDAAAINHTSLHEVWTSSLAALALSLRALAAADALAAANLEDLERHLATLEEKLFAILTTHVPEELLLQFKSEAARDLAAYRSRMTAVQLRQIEQQFVHKRLLEHYQLPRLSLFYMSQA